MKVFFVSVKTDVGTSMEREKSDHEIAVIGRASEEGREASHTDKRIATKRVPAKKMEGRRRFTEDEKALALKLLESGLERVKVAEVVGASLDSLRKWTSAIERKKTANAAPLGAAEKGAAKQNDVSKERSIYAPRDPGQGLSDPEVAGILEWKKQHPSMGPAQLRAQLKRFKGWRLSLKAIARVLKMHGYEPVHKGSKPKGLPSPIRFEAPRRNALWQADFTEVRVHSERLHVLVILDDFSRFIVGHALSNSPSSAVATETLKAAIARHGKPEAVRTDRGGAFVAFTKETDFARFLEAELIDPIRGHSYSPKGGGKVESAIGTLKRELWEIGEFVDKEEAKARIDSFFYDFNHRRAHMGIDGLTPADRFFGRADRVLSEIDAISRKRQGVLHTNSQTGAPIEEVIGGKNGAPLEVLRLVIFDGVMELRFCGAKVSLGRVEC